MMYDLIDYIKENELTTRQAQCLFTDCANIILDVKPDINSDNDKISGIDRIINEIDNLSQTISGICLLRS